MTEKPTEQTTDECEFIEVGTCKGDIFRWEKNGVKGLSVMRVINDVEGNGHFGKWAKRLEGIAKKEGREIWYPSILTARLIVHLSKNGYKLTEEWFEEMGESVIVAKKVIV